MKLYTTTYPRFTKLVPQQTSETGAPYPALRPKMAQYACGNTWIHPKSLEKSY
jgi:hypothetical protein